MVSNPKEARVLTKRVVVCSDPHVGHRVGLTPPEYWAGGRQWVFKQSERWKWFTGKLKELQPFDGAIFLGDICDGTGVKDVSECTIPDLNSQIKAGAQFIDAVQAPKKFMVYGTPVHVRTRDGLELEKEVANLVGCEIHGQIWIDIDGYIVDCRHAPAGNSQVYPANPLIKERESNVRWHDEGAQPLSHIILRGHCHRIYSVGQANRWEAHSVPALQDIGTKYGRQLSNIVQPGLFVPALLIYTDRTWTIREAKPFFLYNCYN